MIGKKGYHFNAITNTTNPGTFGVGQVLRLEDYVISISSSLPNYYVVSLTNAVMLYQRPTWRFQAKYAIPQLSTCITSSSGLLYYATQTGQVFAQDVRQPTTSECFQDVKQRPVLSLAQQDHLLVAGVDNVAQDAACIIWDVRMSRVWRELKESFSEGVGQLAFSKLGLFTGSEDGLVCLFNLAEPDEFEALGQVYQTGSSIHKMGIYQGDQRLWVANRIETFSTWDLNQEELEWDYQDLRKSHPPWEWNYLVNAHSFTPSSSAAAAAAASMGAVSVLAGNFQGSLFLLSLQPGLVNLEQVLGTGGHDDMVRCSAWDDQYHVLYTGGEDGRICHWKPTPGIDQKNHREYEKQREQKRRFKPY